MIDKKLLKVLEKVYKTRNKRNNDCTYDTGKGVYVFSEPNYLSDKEKLLLEQHNFAINEIVELSHDEIVKKLRSVVKLPNLEHVVSNLFIKSASGFHRGIQPIFSFHNAKNILDHSFEPFEDHPHNFKYCRICGTEKKYWENKRSTLYELYFGDYSNQFSCNKFIMDLEEVSTFDNYQASDEEKNIFLKVIDSIGRADNDEFPKKLLSRLAKEKCMPKSNFTTRTAFTKVLIELGVMICSYNKDYSIIDSFIPAEKRYLLAWTGKSGINRNVVEKIMAAAE